MLTSESLDLPDGLRWTNVDDANARAACRCFAAAFAGVDGAYIPNFDDYYRIVGAAERRPRVLMSDDRGVAFSRVVWKDEGARVGEIRIVCRDPAYRARGLGRLALDEALDMIAQMGGKSAWLEVASSNPQAISLYARRGFEELARCPVLCRQLRPR